MFVGFHWHEMESCICTYTGCPLYYVMNFISCGILYHFNTLMVISNKCRDTNGSVHLVLDVFEEVSNRLVCRIHDAHKNLQFWKARGEVRFFHLCSFLKCHYHQKNKCIIVQYPTQV